MTVDILSANIDKIPLFFNFAVTLRSKKNLRFAKVFLYLIWKIYMKCMCDFLFENRYCFGFIYMKRKRFCKIQLNRFVVVRFVTDRKILPYDHFEITASF